MGPVAYRLSLPESFAIHPVFHVSQLRKALGQEQAISSLPPQLTYDLELCAEPADLLGMHHALRGGSNDLKVLIRWANLPAHEDMWESYATIDAQFPHFHLEDKVRLWGGGNDKPSVRFTYSRRKRLHEPRRAAVTQEVAEVEESTCGKNGQDAESAMVS